MPYSMSNLPAAMKDKSKKVKEIFVATFNSVFKESGKEDKSFAIANNAVNQYEDKLKKLQKSQGSFPWHLKAAFGNTTEIEKSDKLLKQVTYVCMAPGVDLHGDYTSVDEIRKAKESFNQNKPKSNLFHSFNTNSFYVIESYQAPVDMMLGEELVEKGAWLVTLQVTDDTLWEMVESGEINGVSIGAVATPYQIEEDIND